jgi:hypothetical protein
MALSENPTKCQLAWTWASVRPERRFSSGIWLGQPQSQGSSWEAQTVFLQSESGAEYFKRLTHGLKTYIAAL